MLVQLRGRREWFDSATWLVLGAGWLLSLPPFAVNFLGASHLELNEFDQAVVALPGWYQQAVRFSILGLLLLCGVLFVGQLRGTGSIAPPKVAGSILFGLAIWLLATVSGYAQGTKYLSLSTIALAACLVTAAVLPRGRGAALGAALFGLTQAITSSALLLVNYDGVMQPCVAKCSFTGNLLFGSQLGENALGILLAISVPFTYLVFKGGARVWLLTYLLLVVAATGSRTSMTAAALSVLIMIMVRPSLDADRPRRLGLAWVFAVLIALVSFGISLYPFERSALTGRPTLWLVAWEYIAGSPWYGWGPTKWSSLHDENAAIVRNAVYATHNEWVEVLFVAGGLGMLLFLAMLLGTILVAKPAVRPAVLAVLTVAFIIGATERPWSLVLADWATFAYLAALLSGPTSLPSSKVPATAGRQLEGVRQGAA